jgi:hypothetical protein
LRFFQPRDVERKRCSLQTHAEKLASRRLVDLSLLQQFGLFNFFVKTFWTKSVAEGLHGPVLCGAYATQSLRKPRFFPGTYLAPQIPSMIRLFHKGPGI